MGKLILVSLLILLVHSQLSPKNFTLGPVGSFDPVDPVDPADPADPVEPVDPRPDLPVGPEADPADRPQPTEEPAVSTAALSKLSILPPRPRPCVLDIKCPRNARWTVWFDRDNPSGFGDYETVADLFREGRGCRRPCWI